MKEAYLKATGEGMSVPLSEVVVDFSQGEAILVKLPEDRSLLQWSTKMWSNIPDFALAVATKGPCIEFSLNYFNK